MAESRNRKNAKCYKHKMPVTIYLPVNEFGNAHGERWHCPKCKGECEKITITN